MKLNFKLDKGNEKKSLGLIVLQTDETIENEFRSIFKNQFNLYHTRISSQPTVTPENLSRMENELPFAVKLLPTSLNLHSVGYACTSGATIIGPKKIETIIKNILPKTNVSNPISAVVNALNSLGAKNIAFVSPYIQSVTSKMREFLIEKGFIISNQISFEQEEESVVARIREIDTLDAILKIPKDSYDAIFISCTNLRTFNILNKAEKIIKKPVISSNLALAWDMVRLSEIKSDHPDGMLFPSKLFEY